MSSDYPTLRFLGYAIPTLPAKMIAIGNPNGPGCVAGSYLGDSDVATDIAARIAVLKHAVDTARALLPPGEDPASVINLFMAPEFFFRGVQGVYHYSRESDDPVGGILQQLAATFPASEYPNWSFVFGSVVTARVVDFDKVCADNSTRVRDDVVEALAKQWLVASGALQEMIFKMLFGFINTCQFYPCLEVRDRALIVSNIPLDTPAQTLNTTTMTTEKYYDSGEDFLLYEVQGRQDVVTEQMTAYPSIDLSHGDLKETAYDEYAIFRQSYGGSAAMDFGVEICLDHFDARLRRNLDNEPFPKAGEAVHVQLVPSCGIQINLPSVAVDTKGLVFNCDGQYALDDTISEPRQGVLYGVDCIYANYVGPGNGNYAGHTQLARVQTPATGDAPNRGGTNATFQTLDPGAITIVPVSAVPGLEKYFAGGPGQVHIYGLETPYVLYP
jgi:hypothetical protein